MPRLQGEGAVSVRGDPRSVLGFRPGGTRCGGRSRPGGGRVPCLRGRALSTTSAWRSRTAVRQCAIRSPPSMVRAGSMTANNPLATAFSMAASMRPIRPPYRLKIVSVLIPALGPPPAAPPRPAPGRRRSRQSGSARNRAWLRHATGIPRAPHGHAPTVSPSARRRSLTRQVGHQGKTARRSSPPRRTAPARRPRRTAGPCAQRPVTAVKGNSRGNTAPGRLGPARLGTRSVPRGSVMTGQR